MPGHCITSIKEERQIQNEHYSIHESAISSLAEHASRLALLTGLPSNASATLTTFSIQHHKTAHGRIRAQCKSALPDGLIAREYNLLITVTDSADAVIASAAASWYVNPNSEEAALVG